MAEKVDLSDDTLYKLAQQLKNIGGNSGGGNSGGGSGAFGEAMNKASKEFNPLADALKLGGSAVSGVSTAYGKLQSVIEPSLGTWRKLSDTGASFGNDIVGMSAAAAGSRLTLDEFADVIKKNSGNFNGLGGNAAKGAENFAKLSKEMADSGVNDDLRRLGMSSKDINEVLALQVGMQQGINMDNEQQRKKAIESAVKLATEMDGMAKLTGVSRKEQEENMKKAQADMQVEAKLRVLTMGKSEEEAAAIRSGFMTQYNEAQLRGQGQMFKEVFATGTVQSQEAANQVAISGREAQMTMAQAKATAAGDAAAASEYSKQAAVESMKNQNDVNKLNLAIYSSNTDAGKSMKESMTATSGMYKAEQAVRAKMEKDGLLAGLSEQQKAAKVHEEALAQIKREQNNVNADGTKKAGSESTDALLKVGRAAGDVESAFMNSVVKPLNEKVGPALNSVAEKVVPAQVIRNKTAEEGGGQVKEGSGAALDKVVRQGFESGQSNTAKTKDEAIKTKQPDTGFVLGNVGRGAGELAGAGGNLMMEGMRAIQQKLEIIPKKAEGGTVTKPELAIIGEAGKEHVIPDDKMQTLMQNVKLEGLSKATEALTKDKSSGGVDMAAMGKMVNTTVSSATSPGSASKVESASPVSNTDQKKIVEEFKNASNDTITMFANSAKRGMGEASKEITNREETIGAIRKKAADEGRELTGLEERKITRAQTAINQNKLFLEEETTRFETLSNFEKIKTQLAQEGQTKAIDSKKLEVAEVAKQEDAKKASVVAQSVFSAMATIGLTENQKTMFGEFANLNAEDSQQKKENLKAEEVSAKEANRAAALARDAIEEKAELEGRKMSEAEEAEYKALGIVLNSSFDKITAAQEEQKVLSRADEQRAFQAKVQATQVEMQTEVSNRLAEITKNNGLASQESLQKEAEFKLIGITQGAEAEAKAREESVKTISKTGSSAEAGKSIDSTEDKTPDQTKPKKGIADMFGDMFAEIKLPDVQKITSTATKINPPEDVAKKAEEDKKAKAAVDAKAAEAKKPAEAAKSTGEVTLKEVHASLEHLNKSMAQMLTYTQQTASATQQQVKATKNLSGNKFG